VAVIVASAAVGLTLAPGLRSASVPRGEATTSLASLPPPSAGFPIPKPEPLADPTGETRWAPVIDSTVARRAPSFASPRVTEISTRTPEGTANLIVADSEVTRRGVIWVRAGLAVLPDGTTGWLPRSALGGWSFVDTRVVVDRRRLTLTLFRAGRPIFRAPVGIGTPADPTPAGSFYVRDRLTSFASPTYGPLAFGTSARAQHLTDWPDGGYVGIHGTDEPQLIPGRISHGCIRLTNPAIVALGRLMPVGTPVVIT
jgi:hypothetical protein